jgi:hypothetical protein
MAKCVICIRDRGKWRKYCSRCRRFVYRAGSKSAHVAALKRDYDGKTDVFRCHYTKIVLNEDDPKSPRYLTFDHMVPAVAGKDNMVITFAMLNEMKTDLSYDQLIRIDRALVKCHDTGKFDEKVLDVGNWVRMARPKRKRAAAGKGRK